MLRAAAMGTLVLAFVMMGGCPQQTTDDPLPNDPNSPGTGDPNTPGGGGDGGLVEGTYVGDVESTTRVFVDGEQASNVNSSTQLQEVIASNGRPVLSTGEPVEEGDALVLAEAGDNFLVGTVTSIVEGDGQLVLNYTIDGEIDGVVVTGVGQTTYDLLSSGALEFTLSLEYSGVDESGQIIRQTELQTGVLAA